jgi:hypothetical protein
VTGSSGEIRKAQPDPLSGTPATVSSGQGAETRTPAGANWKPVLASLLFLPLLLALVLSRWLGTPRETFDGKAVFAQLGLAPVPVAGLHSLAYSKLFFARIRTEPQQRAALLRSLAALRVSRGKADKPIALELERPWWDPPEGVEGTYWRAGGTTVWNPDSLPDLFYAVVLLPGEGDGGASGKASP